MNEYASAKTIALYVNAMNRTMQKNGVTKSIGDTYWSEHIVPILYPVWDSDRDRLETYIRYKDGSSLMYKNKHQRNQKTGEYKWVSYEMGLDVFPENEVEDLYQKLDQKYTEYRDIEDQDLERELQSTFARDNYINWNKLKVIRNFLLQDSDWTQTLDSPLTDEEKELWKQYREKLRDIPNRYGNIPSIEAPFPITPTKYKNLNDDKEYLSDEYEHFYRLNQIVYRKYVSRILAYLSISMTIKGIDDMPVSIVPKPHPNPTLDEILKAIEDGGL